MQVELLDGGRRRTRLELANAIFEYLEISHDRQRKHSALGMVTPVELETRHKQGEAACFQPDYFGEVRAHHSLRRSNH